MRNIVLLLVLVVFFADTRAQTCSVLGQNPGTAFPVCGTSVFSQADVPICGDRAIPGPCGTDPLTDKNPFWYKFTAFTGGSLGFEITPVNLSDDYDWQLFDITGKKPEDVYTDRSLFVACNWSGEGGLTGASARGSSLSVCAGFGKPLWSSMPILKQGHQYLLLISHFTNSQSGYKLEFKGGTASITDPTPPRLLKAFTDCEGRKVSVVMNKAMRCSTLASNGSDFFISGLPAMESAKSLQCSRGFDMDTVEIILKQPLGVGTYQLGVKTGSDGNSILDNCNQGIPETEKISFVVAEKPATPMDSLVAPLCAPNSLELIFDDNIRCSSIASNGSDFMISGPVPVNIISASGVNCVNGLARRIFIQLDKSISRGGNYSITLRAGTDGNTLINECMQPTPSGSVIGFDLKDTVSAGFEYSILEGCAADTLVFAHDGNHSVNRWTWSLDETVMGTGQFSRVTLGTAGTHTAALIVTNGFCSDTIQKDFILDEKLKAEFNGPAIVCPNELVNFTDASSGPVLKWSWNFGNGNTAGGPLPGIQQYPTSTRDHTVKVSLKVEDGKGCENILEKDLLVVSSCVVAVPNAFTPNGDGKNDYLFPSNGYKTDQLWFRVFNRYGQLVFETRDWTRKWDGTVNGHQASTGGYVWMLEYVLKDTGRKFSFKGSTMLLR